MEWNISSQVKVIATACSRAKTSFVTGGTQSDAACCVYTLAVSTTSTITPKFQCDTGKSAIAKNLSGQLHQRSPAVTFFLTAKYRYDRLSPVTKVPLCHIRKIVIFRRCPNFCDIFTGHPREFFFLSKRLEKRCYEVLLEVDRNVNGIGHRIMPATCVALLYTADIQPADT